MTSSFTFLFSVILATAVTSQNAFAAPQDVRDCEATLAVFGTLKLTSLQPTDLRRLHLQAKGNVFRSLEGFWVEIVTRDINAPIRPGMPHESRRLMLVEGTRNVRNGVQLIPVIYGTSGAFVSRDVTGSVSTDDAQNALKFARLIEAKRIAEARRVYGENSGREFFTPAAPLVGSGPIQIPVDTIVSVRLVETSAYTISLTPVYKPNGRPALDLFKTLGEKMDIMAEGRPAAFAVLSELMEASEKGLDPATFQELTKKLSPQNLTGDQVFEGLLKMLSAENIRGEQLEVAFKVYAEGNVNKLISGIVKDPAKLAGKVNEAMVVPDPKDENSKPGDAQGGLVKKVAEVMNEKKGGYVYNKAKEPPPRSRSKSTMN